jgi:hypothetical protein
MAATAIILNFDVTGASIDCSKHNEWPTTPLGTRYRTARSGGKLGGRFEMYFQCLQKVNVKQQAGQALWDFLSQVTANEADIQGEGPGRLILSTQEKVEVNEIVS